MTTFFELTYTEATYLEMLVNVQHTSALPYKA